MTAIERAEALLVAAEIDKLHVVVERSRDFLRGYIGAIKALEKVERRIGIVSGEGVREALADFERFFPETSASAD